MKKMITVVTALLLSLPFLHAQESMFNLGDKVVSLGVGFGSTFYHGSYYSMGLPPISLSYEQAVKDDVLEKGVIGVIGSVGVSSYKYRYDWLGGSYGWNYTNFFFGVGGTFHYPFLDKLDTYAGIMLGYRVLTTKEYGDVPGGTYSDASGGFQFAGFIGARYFFTEKFAAYLQLGYGISYINLGISIKL
jgi:hypothetical protein